MSKKDRILAESGANLEESSGPAESGANPSAARPPAARPPKLMGVERSKDVARIELDRIVPDPDQPRKEFSEAKMIEIVESIRTKGQLQPIRVLWDEPLGKYMILVGERRFRAFQELGMRWIEAVIHDKPLTRAEKIEIQADENLVRDDLKPIEIAGTYRALIQDCGYTQKQVADRFKVTQSAVSEYLSLLGLAPEIQEKVDAGEISTQAAKHIAKVESPEEQAEIAQEVIEGNLTHDQAAAIVKTRKPREASAKRQSRRAKIGAIAKLKTELIWNDSGHKVRVECRKGIQPELVAEVLKRKAEQLATAS